MIKEGEITADEGVKLLEALAVGEGPPAPPEGIDEPAEETLEPPLEAQAAQDEPEILPPPPAPSDAPDFRHLWLVPLAAGAFVAAVGTGIVVLIQASSPGSFFLICGLLPLLLGLAVIGLAFWSRTARWLHVRIRGEQRITLSFPLPLRFGGWLLRLARPYVPQLRDTALDEVILSLDQGLADEGGVFVDVHDDETGEHVQVYIG
jgi:hypothetical protein